MPKYHPLDDALRPLDGIFAAARKKAMDAVGPGPGQVELSKREARTRLVAELAAKTPEQRQAEFADPRRAMEVMELLEKKQ